MRESHRAISSALLIGAMLIGALQPAAADCGLNMYPPLSRYGYDADQCKIAWQLHDWNKVVRACTNDAQDAGADPQDFTGLTIAAQSWAKAAIGYDKMGQSDRASDARSKALTEIRAAIAGFEGEQPTPDDESAQSASTLEASLSATNFYSPTGCAP